MLNRYDKIFTLLVYLCANFSRICSHATSLTQDNETQGLLPPIFVSTTNITSDDFGPSEIHKLNVNDILTENLPVEEVVPLLKNFLPNIRCKRPCQQVCATFDYSNSDFFTSSSFSDKRHVIKLVTKFIISTVYMIKETQTLKSRNELVRVRNLD